MIKKITSKEFYTSTPGKIEIDKINEIIDYLNNNIKSKPKNISANKYKNKDGKYDLPIGTKFIYQGRKYKVANGKFRYCLACDLYDTCINKIAVCGVSSVIFKEIE
jgi:hypothetical protein